jgi:cytoplasmic protein
MCSTKDEKYLELKEAINSLDNKNEVMEIQNIAKDNIIADIMNKFVIGNPRVWWLAFKKKPKSFSFDDEFQYQRISQFFDNNDVCYLITELDTIHLFKLPVRNIIKIIGECSFFEYYVTDLKMQNLLCETDHGDLLYL